MEVLTGGGGEKELEEARQRVQQYANEMERLSQLVGGEAETDDGVLADSVGRGRSGLGSEGHPGSP